MKQLAPLLCLIALPVLAAPGDGTGPETPDVAAATASPVPLDDWRALTDGRTVWYLIDGELWGRERYHAGSSRPGDEGAVTFQDWTGQCLQGRWTYESGVYCFDFGHEAPHCFRHLRAGERLFVAGVDGGVQEVARIDDTPVVCEDQPTS